MWHRPYVCPSYQRIFDHNARIADVAQPPPGLFGEAAASEFPDARWRAWRQRFPVRLLRNHCRQGVGNRLLTEKPLAREHLIEHHSESPDVSALVHWLAPRLLRTHVGCGPQDDPLACRRRADRG